MARIQENLEKQIYNQISPIMKAYHEPIVKAGKAVAEITNYYNNYINTNREKVLATFNNISNIMNTFETVHKETIVRATRQMSDFFQTYNDIYNEKIINIIENMNRTMEMAFKGNIYQDISFDNIILNNNGTIEYEGTLFEKEEIEETTNELIEEINSKSPININTILKKIIFSFICCFGLLCFPNEILQWFSLALNEGFKGYVGLKMIEFIIEEFKRIYPLTANKDKNYFNNHCAIVKLDRLDLRIAPSINEKKIGELYEGQLINVLELKPYWARIEYNGQEYISGWVSIRGLNRFNKLTSQFEKFQ